MSRNDREYEAFQIFEQVREGAEESETILPKSGESGEPLFGKKEKLDRPSFEEKAKETVSLEETDVPFYEIEYDSCPLPGVGKFVLKSQKVEAPVRDEVREKFNQMRDIARKNQYLYFENSRFYDKRIRQENSKIFYEQGMFMKDFEDYYEKEVPFSSYFPSYQMMGYEQLRTYFTWRTKVRQGEVVDTSTSYFFLYLYELINQIGVEDEAEGLEKLMDFWLAVRAHQGAIGKYVLRWLKDYHVYYELPWTFKEFIEKNGLSEYYPELTDPEDNFELLCSISKYDIRKSVFYGDGKEAIIKDCFHFTFQRLKQVFAEKGLDLEALIFQPTKNMPQWTPFKDALFYPVKRQRDRRVVLSEKEIYLCSKNNWTFNTTLTTESGKRLLGYVMKQLEAVLRKAVKYKYKISAGSLNEQTAEELKRAGVNLEAEVTSAVLEFYREATKTVVKVDPDRLSRIRQEALQTQERLIVPEEKETFAAFGQIGTPIGQASIRQEASIKQETSAQQEASTQQEISVQQGVSIQKEISIRQEASIQQGVSIQQEVTAQSVTNTQPEPNDPWVDLWDALTEVEREALQILWKNETDIRQFADREGIMLEVLAEGINEKAMDYVGDGLLDSELAIYEDYADQVKEMLKI